MIKLQLIKQNLVFPNLKSQKGTKNGSSWSVMSWVNSVASLVDGSPVKHPEMEAFDNESKVRKLTEN